MCVDEDRGMVGEGDNRKIRGGFSHESEHDLALMVSDFLENDGSSGPNSWRSSDNKSSLGDGAGITIN